MIVGVGQSSAASRSRARSDRAIPSRPSASSRRSGAGGSSPASRAAAARAEELFERSGHDLPESVLLAVSPGQRVVEVVTGSAAARRLPDRACALAVLSMTNAFGSGDLVGGIVNGLRQLSDQAGHPRGLRPH